MFYYLIDTDFILVEMITGDFGPTVIIRDSRITEKQKQNPLTVERMDLTAIKNSAAGNWMGNLALTLKRDRERQRETAQKSKSSSSFDCQYNA